MKSTTLTFLFLIFGISQAWAQEILLYSSHLTYSGVVVDSITNEPLVGVVISEVTGETDRVSVRSSVTNRNGAFSIKADKAPEKRFEFSCLGYTIQSRRLLAKANETGRKIDTIRMVPDIYLLDEVLVKSRMEMYRICGDTIVYFPRAVKTMQGDPVLEVLRLMPGVTVNEQDEVFIGGVKVERTYINNKLIFGEDAVTPLRTIEAKEVHMIQAYDEIDEGDKVLHGENARKRKVLNLLTFKDFEAMVTADVDMQAGIDIDKDIDNDRNFRYYLSGNAGSYATKLQISLGANVDNRNDYSGISNSSGNYKRSQNASFSVSAQPNPRNSYLLLYMLFRQRNKLRAYGETSYYPTEDFDSQTDESETNSSQTTTKHLFNLHYRYTGEKLSITFLPTISYAPSRQNTSFGNETTRDNLPLLSFDNYSGKKENEFVFSQIFEVKKRFEKHSASFQLITRINNAHHTVHRNDTIRMAGQTEQAIILKTTTKRPSYYIAPAVNYNIPLSKGTLYFNTSVSYDQSSSDELTLDLITGGQDNMRSGKLTSKKTNTTGSAGYTHTGKKSALILNLSYSALSLSIDETLPTHYSDARFFHALLPDIQLSRNNDLKWHYNIRFTGRQSVSEIRRFTAWINDDNPLFVSAGNPILKPALVYTLEMENNFLLPHSKAMTWRLKGSLNYRSIVNNRVYFHDQTVLTQYNNYLIAAGATLNVPVNGDQTFQFDTSLEFDSPVAWVKSILQFSADYSYSNPQAAIDSKFMRNQQHRVGSNLNLTSNFSSRFKLELKNRFEYSRFKNHTETIVCSLAESASLNMRWDLSEKLSTTCHYLFDYYKNQSTGRQITNHLLNASLGYRLLKEKRGRVSINGYNLLNRANNLSTIVNDQYIRNELSPKLSGYITLSFEYRFRNAE